MKTTRLSFLTLSIAMLALFAIGCDKEESSSTQTVTLQKLTAKCAKSISFDSSSEDGIFLADGWSRGDEISILDDTGTCVGILSTSSSGSTVDFTGSVEVEVGEYYLALYPSIAVGKSYVYDTSTITLTIDSNTTNLDAIKNITNFYPESFYITSDGEPNKTIEFIHRFTFITFYTSVPDDDEEKDLYENIFKNGNKLSLYSYDESNDNFRASVFLDKSSSAANTSLLGFLEDNGANYVANNTLSNKIYVAIRDQIGDQALRWVLEDTSGVYDPIYYEDNTSSSYEMGNWTYKYVQGTSWSFYTD